MQMKKTILVGGALVALLSSSALVMDAFAQKGAVLQPRTSWSLKHVNGTGSVKPYCAIARQFDGNLILTLARNSALETSLALDFEGKAFQTSRLTRIVLDPGSGQERSFNLKPASGRAFVVKLGRDEPFYKALLKTGYLRADIDGGVYNFNLADIDGGKDELNSCLATHVQPAAGAVGGGVRASSQNSPLLPAPGENRELAELRVKLARLQQDNVRLKAQKPSVPAVSGTVHGEQWIKLQLENENLRAVLNTTNRDLEEARRLVASLENSAQGRNDYAGERVILQERLDALEQENRVLSRQSEDARGRLSEARGVLKTAKDETSRTFQALQQDQKQVVEGLRLENQKLAHRLSSLETGAGGISAEDSARMQSALNELRQDNEALRTQLDAAHVDETENLADIASYEEKIGSLEDALAEQRGISERYIAQIQDFQGRGDARFSELEQTLAALKEEKIELAGLLQDITAEASRIPDLEQKYARAEQTLEDLRLQLSIVEAENVDLKQAERLIESQEVTVSNLRLEYEGALEKLRSELVSVSDQKIRLETELDESQAEIARLVVVRDDLDLLKDEGQTIRAQLSSSAGLLRDMETSYAALQEDHKNLQTLLEAAEQDVVQKEDILIGLQEENKFLQASLEEVSDALAFERERVEVFALAELQSGEQDQMLESLSQEKEEILERLSLAEIEQEKLKQDRDVLAQDYADLQTEHEVFQSEIDRVQLALRDENAALTLQVETLSQDLDTEKMLVADLVARADDLAGVQHEFAGLQDEILALKSRNVDLEKKSDDFNQILNIEKDLKDTALQNLSDMEERLFVSEVNNQELAQLLQESQEAGKLQMASLKEYEERLSVFEEMQEQVPAVDLKDDILALKTELSVLQEENGHLKDALGQAQIDLAMRVEASDVVADIPPVVEQEEEKTVAVDLEPFVSAVDQGQDVPQDQANESLEILDITESPSVLAAVDSDMDTAPVVQDLPDISELVEDSVVAVEVPLSVADVSDISDQTALFVPPLPLRKPDVPVVMAEVEKIPSPVATDAESLEIVSALEHSVPLDDGKDAVSDTLAYESSAIQPAAGVDDQLPDEDQLQELQDGEVFSLAQGVVPAETQPLESYYRGDLSEAQRQEMELSHHIQGEVEPESSQPENFSSVLQDRSVLLERSETEISAVTAPIQPIEKTPSDVLALEPVVEKQLETPQELSLAHQGARGFEPSVHIETILHDAGIPVHGPVAAVEEAMSSDLRAYQWQSSGDLYGSAHQKPIGHEAEFDVLVENYLTNTEERCVGDFAISPAMTVQSGTTRIDSYEIACIGDGVDSSASLLFFNRSGTFTIVAHETPTEHMAQAMDYRDRLVKALQNS